MTEERRELYKQIAEALGEYIEKRIELEAEKEV